MIYNKYGKTFQLIRKQLKLPLSYFTSYGISTTSLSDFENGKTMMRFDKVLIALDAMNISLAEFELALNHYHPSEMSSFLQKLKESIILDNETELQKLLNVAQQSNNEPLVTTVLITLNKHNNEDIIYLIDFLYNASYWSFTEISIFYIVMSKLPPKDIKNILNHIRASLSGIFLSLHHYRELIPLLCKAITVFSYHGYKEEAKNIIDLIEGQRKENSLLTDSLYLINLYYAAKGYWIYLFVNPKEGKMIIEKFLNILSLAAKPQIFQYYKRIYNKYI
jgi:transcriptional activator, Rgg/GadR/MutR family, C-terminal domain